jgi:hypothetical protein
LELSDEAFVFHDPGRTFHPKVYLALGTARQSLLVGSSNLTAGGLAWNYEASLWLDWSQEFPDATVNAVHSWFGRLISEEGACHPLTEDLIEAMINSKDIIIQSELRARRTSKQGDAPEDTDSTEVGSITGLFTGVEAQLRRLPRLSAKSQTPSRTKSIAPEDLGSSGVPDTGTDPLPLTDEVVVHRWYRQMQHSQAQQKLNPDTKVRGSMTLTQADSKIDHLTYFYESFFYGLPWSLVPDKQDQLEVEVAFHTWIDGHDLGVHNLRVSHAPHRAASQGNVPTWLHWGSLMPYLQATSYVGFFTTLERMHNSEFVLIIDRRPNGEYL